MGDKDCEHEWRQLLGKNGKPVAIDGTPAGCVKFKLFCVKCRQIGYTDDTIV